MKNTQKIKNLLTQAMQLSSDLPEVRYHIAQALAKVSHLEKKKEHQQPTQAQSWHDMLKNGVQNPYTSKRVLDIINQMLAQEQDKLEPEGETLLG